MSQICYTGPFMDSSGYGEANRNAIKAFYEAGADIKTELVKFTKGNFSGNPIADLAMDLSKRDIPYKVKIIHTTPDVYKNYMEKGKYHIGHLFWETDRLPHDWVAACNKMDEIWCGGITNANAIINSGVTVPVRVFPQAINIDVPTDAKPFRIPGFDKGFVFYSIFEWTERKNPRALLTAFWKEFKLHDDVCLLIKTHKGSFTDQGVQEIIGDARRWKNELGFNHYPKVFLCTNMLTEEDKWRLHATGQVYVSSHRGEGWGIPPVEASLMSKPVIAVKYGGVFDWLNGTHIYIVEHTMKNVDKIYNRYYSPDMQWADASEESLRASMRKLYNESEVENKKKNLLLRSIKARNIMRTFNFKSVGDAMLERVNEIYNGEL